MLNISKDNQTNGDLIEQPKSLRLPLLRRERGLLLLVTRRGQRDLRRDLYFN